MPKYDLPKIGDMQRIPCRLTGIIVLGLLVNFGPTSLFAGVLVCEDFDRYSPGSLVNANGGTGWDGPWLAPSGSATVMAFDDASSDAALCGNAVSLGGNSRVVRKLNVRDDGPLAGAGIVQDGLVGRDGVTLYVGFLQRVTVLPTADPKDPAHLRFYGVEFNTSPADNTRVLEIGHDDRGNPGSPENYGVASVVNNKLPNHEPGQFRSLGLPDADANLIVVKFTFGPHGQDTVEVYRNPESATLEAACTVDAKLEGTFRFDRIALARFVGGTPLHQVDEIRFGTEFAHVLPPQAEERQEALLAMRQERRRQTARAITASGLDGEKLLFVKRQMFRPTHIYTEVSDGPFLPGGGIFVLSPVAPDGQATMIFDAVGGICRDPEISFDGCRVLFSYRPSEDEYYHIHEMNIDGTNLKQISSGPFHDLDPFYLPDGRIGMTSTRCKSRALCFWVRAATLFVMDADGGDVRPLTSNNVNEFTPDMLPDGRVLYTRWEYLDKTAIFVQSLWSILPDGTGARQIYGNNLIHPVSMLQARPIPGSKKIACILTAHNGNSYGPLALVDPTLGVNNPAGILNLVPEVNYDRGCFAPYPLSDRWCLVSYGPDEPYGIYLFAIDPKTESIVPANKEHRLDEPQFPTDLGRYWASATTRRHTIYRDPTYSCVEAMPVVPRKRPSPVGSALASHADPEPTSQGTLLLADVYRGLQGAVPRGRVKYLRIVEEVGHRDELGQRDYQGAFNHGRFLDRHPKDFMSLYASPWEGGNPAPSLQAKQVWGTVPVEADGSAHFLVPAERPIYFQALDKDFNELQRMRSYIHLKPDERLSCIGCHERRQTTPPSRLTALPTALGREPSTIEPPPWGAGPFSYQTLVQPILDRRCAECHGSDDPSGGVNLSAVRDKRGVPASFSTLVRPRKNPDRPPLVDFFDSWWGVSRTVPVAKPMSFGTVASRLIEVIDSRHADLPPGETDRTELHALTPEERRVITTWIDLNCPLWDSYSPELHVTSTRPGSGR